MENKNLCVGELLKFGYETFKKNWLFLIGVFLLATIVWSIPCYIGTRLEFTYPFWARISNLICYILSTLVSVGLIRIVLQLIDGKTPSAKELFIGWDRIIPFFIAHILFSVIFLVGLLLLIVPGIIWGVRYSLYPFFVIEKGEGPIKALQSSAAATYGAKWDLLAFFGASILIVFAGLLFFGVGVYVAWPIVMLGYALAYRKLIAQTTEVHK